MTVPGSPYTLTLCVHDPFISLSFCLFLVEMVIGLFVQDAGCFPGSFMVEVIKLFTLNGGDEWGGGGE